MAIFRLTTNAANTLANALSALVDAGGQPGQILIFQGTEPSTADTAYNVNNLLATVSLAFPSFMASVDGLITANTILTWRASATGTASWARIVDSTGKAVFDVDVGTSSASTMNLSTDQIVINGPVLINSFTIQVPLGD